MQGDISIPTGFDLIIESGVEVLFHGDCGLDVNGALAAGGTALGSIRFDADAVEKWRGIYIGENADSSQLVYCIVGRGAATGAGIDLDGGGIHCTSGDAPITQCAISNNRANGRGGGLFISVPPAENATISDCDISNNSVVNNGGGMQATGGGGCEYNFSDCQFLGNHAVAGGGSSVELHSTASVRINDCNFIENWGARGRGSGVFSDHGTLTLSQCNFDYNFTYGYGAG